MREDTPTQVGTGCILLNLLIVLVMAHIFTSLLWHFLDKCDVFFCLGRVGRIHDPKNSKHALVSIV